MKIIVILFGIISAILLSDYFSSLTIFIVAALLFVVLRLSAILLLKRFPHYFISIGYLHYLLSYIFALSLGALSVWVNAPTYGNDREGIPNYDPATEYQIQGVIESRATSATSERYQLKVRRIITTEEQIGCRNVGMQLFTPGDIILTPGAEISFISKLRVGDDGAYSAFIKNTDNYQVTGYSRSLKSIAQRCNEKIAMLIENSNLTESSIALAKALLLADKGGVKPRTQQTFRDAGLSHILALSGLHAGILTMTLLWLTMPMMLIRARNARYITVIVGIWIFALLTGMNYSTVRAALMLSITAIAWIMERQRDSYQSVCVAAVIILLFSPAALYDVGFQLSFLCVMSICLFVEKLNPVSHHEHPKTYKVCGLLLTTIIAVAATWTLTGYYFGSIPLNFMQSNLILIPLLPILMSLLLLYVILLSLGVDLEIMAYLIDKSIDGILRLASQFLGTSLSISPQMSTILLWYLGMTLAAISLYIIPPIHYSGAAVNQESTRVSYPWLTAAILSFLLSAATLIF